MSNGGGRLSPRRGPLRPGRFAAILMAAAAAHGQRRPSRETGDRHYSADETRSRSGGAGEDRGHADDRLRRPGVWPAAGADGDVPRPRIQGGLAPKDRPGSPRQRRFPATDRRHDHQRGPDRPEGTIATARFLSSPPNRPSRSAMAGADQGPCRRRGGSQSGGIRPRIVSNIARVPCRWRH